MTHFSSLQEFHKYMGWPPPEHPQLSLMPLDSTAVPHRRTSPPISSDLYMIILKRVISGALTYGRTDLDFSCGTMLFFAPRQAIEWQEVEVVQQGFMIQVHEDYFRNCDLGETIKTYGYFSYAVNEALHLSPKEETIITSIYQTMASEYHNNQDEFSKDIMISQIATMLKYANRFYKRQFLNRKDMTSDLILELNKALITYFETDKCQDLGAPSIDWVAERLAVTPRYLSDALKAESGKTALEHIHLFLIEQAKNLLLEPRKTVAEVAYQLGFQYPQYFSRFFKKKVGMSPSMFQEMQGHA